MTMNADEQYERGLVALRQADGGAGQKLLEALADVSPELSQRSVAWSYGDLYVRPELQRRDRELLTLGILTGLGGAEAQLEVHVNGALNAGLTPSEIVEALLQSVVYCGVPRAVNATLVAKKVFAERNLLPVRPAPAG
ncbi:carboxymuconolactone decarboxylase family protein [Polymorphospora rubra]|uniref:4-carboxymuconolactone decarboxylase n=2 Tax=Polymorphospora rubra TaxID=338584 RepID=A0A810MTB4_9ACTN|nr:carboxymuconolactone decarboxylase family protein [Polymorphospora rubra]BCJ63740.1 4-carboxymuconolactone decarboxylase [Polymorphospora rubra]